MTFKKRHLQNVGASIVLNCVNVPGTEISSVVATKDGGTLAFVSLETSFSRSIIGTKAIGIFQFVVSAHHSSISLRICIGKNIKVVMGAGARGDLTHPFAILTEVPMLNYLFHEICGENISPV